METAPRNCGFLSLVVVDLVLSLCQYLDTCVKPWDSAGLDERVSVPEAKSGSQESKQRIAAP